jgi:hypothetical protein
MQITDSFVYLHMPKTGGTFVTSILRSIYSGGEEKYVSTMTDHMVYTKDKLVIHPRHGRLLAHKNKHGIRAQIPLGHRRKEIVTTMRNPLDWYVSQYCFGWWKRDEYRQRYKNMSLRGAEIKDPSGISFEQFVDFIDAAFPSHLRIKLKCRHELGYMSRQFLYYHLKRPRWAMLNRFAERKALVSFVKDETKHIQFLGQENLNADLYNYLKKWGYTDATLQGILGSKRILPAGSSRTDSNWQSRYTEGLLRSVLKKDWLLFQLFPRYKQGLSYDLK